MSRSDFWSRRRAAVEAEAAAEEAAVVAAQEAEVEAKLAERSDEELLEELDLPQPEELETPEAVREFMNSALPQRLKTRALRRLWRLNPVLANLDGLLDYGEDYTDAANVVENLQTAYQVGKGMMAHVEELARQAEEADATEQTDTPDESVEEIDAAPDADVVPEDTPELDVTPEPEPVLVATIEPTEPEFEEEPVYRPVSSRRMQFQFETTT